MKVVTIVCERKSESGEKFVNEAASARRGRPTSTRPKNSPVQKPWVKVIAIESEANCVWEKVKVIIKLMCEAASARRGQPTSTSVPKAPTFLSITWTHLNVALKCTDCILLWIYCVQPYLELRPMKVSYIQSNFRITKLAMFHHLFVGWRWQEQPQCLPGGAMFDKMPSSPNTVIERKRKWKRWQLHVRESESGDKWVREKVEFIFFGINHRKSRLALPTKITIW